jgi:protein-S-isoprenylcysteine O-methyltransferase Ste14
VDRLTHTPSAAERVCAWGGAAVFVTSLSYALYSYDVTFRQEIAGSFTVAPILWNIALFSVFALHHSAFARMGMRDRIARRFPTLERSIYVWVASLLLIAVCAWWQPVGGVTWRATGALAAVLDVLHIIGIVLAVASAAIIDIWELAGIRQVYPGFRAKSPEPKAQSPEFKTTGPYGLVRHPIYLGWFLIVFAVGTMTMTRFAFAVISSLYVLIAIPFEERSLLETTAGSYERYRQKVRFKLVPGVY